MNLFMLQQIYTLTFFLLSRERVEIGLREIWMISSAVDNGKMGIGGSSLPAGEIKTVLSFAA